jgi:hypothetical protein
MAAEREWVTPICGVTGKELPFEDRLQPAMPRYSKNKKATVTNWLHLDKNEPTVAALLEQKYNAEKELWRLHNQSPTSLYYKGPKTEVNVAEVVDVEVMEAVEADF